MRDIDAVSLEGNIENSFIRQGVEEMRENPGISEAHAFVRQRELQHIDLTCIVVARAQSDSCQE